MLIIIIIHPNLPKILIKQLKKSLPRILHCTMPPYQKMLLLEVLVTYQKAFNGKLYTGKVIEIRSGAANGLDRRCIYNAGDSGDLSVADLKLLASSDPNKNNIRASTSMPMLTFNNKLGDEGSAVKNVLRGYLYRRGRNCYGGGRYN